METNGTDSLILDATMELLGEVGMAGLGLEEVARRAGVSRQTLYRYFGNRSSLINAAIIREEERLMEQVLLMTDGLQGLAPVVEAALLTLLRWRHDHPLLRTLLETEPEALVPMLTSGDGPVLSAARTAIGQVLGERLPAGADRETAGDLLARVMLSYVIDPPAGRPEDVAHSVARLIDLGFTAS